MRRLYWIISPWPNAALAIVLLACTYYQFWPIETLRVPIVAGVLVGLVPAVIDAFARPAVRPELLAVTNLAQFTVAFRSRPLARARLLVGVVLLVAVGLYIRPQYESTDYIAGLMLGFVATHFASHAMLGLWTAWPREGDTNAL